MAYEFTNEDRLRDATRLHNRALRTLNRNIRHRLEQVREEMDTKVKALLDTPTEAEAAFMRLYTGLKLNCDPNDYNKIVDYILVANGY